MTVSKHLTLLLVSALMLFSLAACGCSAKDKGNAGTNNTVTGSETVENGSADTGKGNAANSNGSVIDGSTNGNVNDTHNGTANNGNSLVDDAQNAVNEGIDDVQNALDGNNGTAKNSSAGGVSFRKMLENGRVHDKDGDLTDGENSVSSGRLF